jgi:hypothetical protein
MTESTLDHGSSAVPPPPVPRWERMVSRIQFMTSLASLSAIPLSGISELCMPFFPPRFPHDVAYIRFAVDDWGNLLAGIGFVLGVVFLIATRKHPHPRTVAGMIFCVLKIMFSLPRSL